MAFEMPSIKELAQQVRTSFRSEMPSTDAWIWGNTLTVISKVFAGIVWTLFGRLKWIDKQRFASTATGTELERHGSEVGISRKPASYASGYVIVKGTPSNSSTTITIPAGTAFTRSDGIAFVSSVSVDMSLAGTATIPVTAQATGPASNSLYGTILTCADANVTSATVSSDGIGGGASIESYEELRERILFRKRNPPQGGSLTDYIIWATSVTGVTRAFVDNGSNCGPGIVVVYPMLDNANASNYGLPTAADLAAVQAYIETVKPVTARVVVASPAPYFIDVVVNGLTPGNAETKQAAADEIYNSVYRNARVTTSRDTNILHRSWIWQAVASVLGQQHFEIVKPDKDISLPVGSIPVVSSVTFT